MDSFKKAAKRLAARLKQGGVAIPLSLAYEGVAAVHNERSWNVLRAKSAGSLEDMVRTARSLDSFALPERFISADTLRPQASLTVLLGASGSGKTSLGLAFLRQAASENHVPIHFHDGSAERYGVGRSDMQPQSHSFLEDLRNWAQVTAPGVVLIDEFVWFKECQFELGAVIAQVLERGHNIYLAAQSMRDVAAMKLDIHAPTLVPRTICLGKHL